jgi:ubiquinone biosynthesis monooxygenase Coq7
MTARRFTSADRLIAALDAALHTLGGPEPVAARPNPAADRPDAMLDDDQRRLAGRLMRVNHAGEVAAQALYQGQALTARLPLVREKMEQAAREENDHLAWTAQRLDELGAHTSRLDAFWYAGAFAIGALAGAAGDRWSLGFVAETERQVVDHLSSHLARLPASDEKSRAILEQMRADEAHHATTAVEAGGAPLPAPVQEAMRRAARVMTGTAYWI